jgi:hypothetical protein
MMKLVAAFASGVIITALIAFATQGHVKTAATAEIAPSQMTIGQHLSPERLIDYSLVFP